MSQLWLGIDGALGSFSAALVSADDSLPPRFAASAGNDALERGLAIVSEVLAEVAVTELVAIAVGTGPGSFTGLRIALSYAKSLAFAADLPLAGVSSYDTLTPPGVTGTHATFVHGRTGIACARLRMAPEASERWDERIACGTYGAIAEALAEVLPAGSRLYGYGAAAGVAPALGERGITVLSDATHVKNPALAVVRCAIAANVPASPHALRADYGEAHYAERQAPSARPATPEATF